MNSSSSSLAQILAAPWQQHRNTNGQWTLVFVVAMCFMAQTVLFAFSLANDQPQQVAFLRGLAARGVWIGVFVMVVVAWTNLVTNLLRQNTPALARLVPHHAGQLRTALLVAWTMAILLTAAVPGFGLDAPLAWACGAAGGLALLALAIRWPLHGVAALCLGGIAIPVLATPLAGYVHAEALRAIWEAHALLWTALVCTGGALMLVVVVRGGDAQHRSSYESCRRLGRRHSSVTRGRHSSTAARSKRAFRSSGLYDWWMDRLLARRDIPLMSRLLAGLGPGTHWTARLYEICWYVVIFGGLCVLMRAFLSDHMLASILPWFAFSVLTNGAATALRAVPQLREKQREQGLLVLLPGVPRGARLNRWLAWNMSVAFIGLALVDMGLAWGLDAWAEAIEPGAVVRSGGSITIGVAVALLPLVVWQWRRWARMRAASGLGSAIAMLATVGAGVAIPALHSALHVGYVPIGLALAAAAFVYCVWRWWRMGSEPSALPVGRLA